MDDSGRVYVTDPEGFRVLIFSAAGAYLNRFGQYGADVNSLALPNGVAVAPDGTLWLADAGNNRVLAFAPIYGAPVLDVPAGEEPAGQLEPPGEQDEQLAPTDAGPGEGYPGGEP